MSATAASAPSAPGPSWKRPFFTLWTGQVISLVGSGLVQFALVWWLTTKTGSATVLTTAVLIAMLPNVILAPVAGVVVDRRSRRLVMIVADATAALATLWLAVMFTVNRVEVWHVYVALCVRGAAGAFQLPAAQSTISLMVPEAHLARVAGLNQMVQGLLTIASPPVGALLLAMLPFQGVMAIDVVTAIAGIGALLVVAIPRPAPATNVEARPSFWAELAEGLRYVRGWSGLMVILVMATVINFFLIAAAALMPMLVTLHFGGKVLDLAKLESIFGGGALVGGVVLGVWGGFRPRILTFLVGLVGIGAGFLLMGLAPTDRFELGLASAFLAATMVPMANGPMTAVLQSAVAPRMQGRVFALVTSAVTAVAPLGLLVAGPVADLVGVRVWYIAGGTVCAAMGIAGLFVPAVMRIEERARSKVAESQAPPPDDMALRTRH